MRRNTLVLLLLILLSGAGPLPPASAQATGSPYDRLAGWVDPGSQAARAAQRARLHPDRTRVWALRRLALQPQYVWLGTWLPASGVRSVVADVAVRARAAGRLPQFVVYAVPHRDCGQYSAGGLEPAAYLPWLREVAAGLSGGPSAVIVEPDGLGLLDCLSPALAEERLRLLREAVALLSAAGATTYLDAGHAAWHSPEVMAERLRRAGVARARGISLNVAGWGATDRQVAYARELAARLPGLRAVIDTGRNGAGGVPGEWCNVARQAVGLTPRPLSDSVVDALVWVKRPGESDGACGRGEPPAGAFWTEQAVGLVTRARRPSGPAPG